MYYCLLSCFSLSTAGVGLTKLLGFSVGDHVKGLGEGAVGVSVGNVGGVLVELVSGRGRGEASQGGGGGDDDGRRTHFFLFLYIIYIWNIFCFEKIKVV